MKRLERGRRHHFYGESRRGGKFLTMPLFMQVLGILNISAFYCARAAAVTGAVGYESAVAATSITTTFVTTRGGGMGASTDMNSSIPERDERVLKSRRNERTIANRRCVIASAGGMRSTQSAKGRKAHLPAVTLWDRRRTAPTRVGNNSSSPRAMVSAFLPPPPSSGCVCSRQHRTRAGSRGLSFPVVQLPSRQRVLVVGSPAPGRTCPLSMTSATDFAEAAAAVLGAVAAVRFALPEVDHGYVGLRFPSAAVQGSVSRLEDAGRVGDQVSTSSNSDSGGRSRSTSRIQDALVSLVRWVLSGGRVGVRGRKRPRVMPRVPEDERGEKKKSGGLLALLSWIWRFTGGESSTAKADSSKNIAEVVEEKLGSEVMGSGRGRDLAVMPSASTATAGQSSTVPQVQYWFPRPQSTAYPRPQSTVYPRPQSTAYPRPRVSVPTLLDLDREEPLKAMPTGKKLLASSLLEKKGAKGNGSDSPMLSDFLRWFFARMITKRAKLVEGLEVNVDARSNREAMSGLLQEVGITFNHLELENLQISGGAVMAIRGLDLKVLTLLWRRFKSFKKPFEDTAASVPVINAVQVNVMFAQTADPHAEAERSFMMLDGRGVWSDERIIVAPKVSGSYVFTSEDLAFSPMVRRLVDRMMNATLRKLETYATDPLSLKRSVINISQVTAKRSRLVIDGEMLYENARVPFNYRTSIGVRGKGHVVYLKDSEVFWENVGGSLSLPLVPLQTFDVDIGDSARIESIRIVNGKLAVRARFVLSPFPPLVVASMLKRAALRYDVGEKLSVVFDSLIQNMKFL